MNIQQKTRVLIAEDDYLVGELVKGSLVEAGYAVVGEATSGREALEMTQSLRPDVIIMDIKMPDMDGLEATRQIYTACPTPIVILTAYDAPELVKEASEAGVGAYLIKPPGAREMERAIVVARARFEDMVTLRRLNSELKARNEEINTFARTVAHQLKNSASLITTFGAVLRDQLKLSGEPQQYLDSIIQSGRKMNNIIAELQVLAGVREGDVEPDRLDMDQIVAEVEERLAHVIEEKNAQIIKPEQWPTAMGYAPWVEEVWMNYIGNGIKYGGDPPRLELGATPESEGMLRFWVRDNGRGISPEEQENLFEPFTKLSRVRVEGQGLGLSIVRHIVEKLGGSVGVESEGVPGEGTVFYFTLPAAK